MNNSILLYLLLLILSLTNCKTQVKEHFETMDPIPVVNGLLIQDSVVKIHLSKTRGLDDQELELVSDATVSLLVDDVWVENLSYQYEGYYRGQTVVEAGHKYTCQVEIAGFETLYCEDSIPLPTLISSINHINKATVNEEGRTIPAVEYSFTNNLDQEKFYQFVIHLKRNPGSEHEHWSPAYLQETIDPILLSEGLGLSVFTNSRIMVEHYTMHINYSSGSYSCRNDSCWTNLSPLVFELRSISKNYYNYLTQLKLYEQGRFPDFGAISYGVFPLHSNISHGYGIFAGFSTVFSDTIIPY